MWLVTLKTYASHSPEKIWVRCRTRLDLCAVPQDNIQVNEIVGYKAVVPLKSSMATSETCTHKSDAAACSAGYKELLTILQVMLIV